MKWGKQQLALTNRNYLRATACVLIFLGSSLYQDKEEHILSIFKYFKITFTPKIESMIKKYIRKLIILTITTTLFSLIIYLISNHFGINFTHPIAIIIGVIVSIILSSILFYIYQKNSLYFKFIDDVQQVFQFSQLRFWGKILLFAFILTSFGFIFSQPVKKFSTKNIEKNGIDIALVLDISKSMDAEDLKPTRLQAAKNIISKFLDKIKNDRVGLVIFAGAPFTSLPLTFDYNIIKETIKNLTTNTINQNNPQLNGTAIGDALLMAKNILIKKNENKQSNKTTRQKVVILLTDGDANKGVDPILAAQYLAKFGIKVYTIGIGSPQGGYIKYKIGPFTQLAKIPPLKTDTLEKIAKITGGKFFRATDNQTLAKIFDQLSKLTKTKIKVRKKVINENMYRPFALLSLILLLAFSYLRVREI